jgi:hypothetical protein
MDRTWENQTYKQLRATITNGVKSFSFVASDRNEPLPKIEPFKRARVAVEHANTEKGIVTVRGKIVPE